MVDLSSSLCEITGGYVSWIPTNPIFWGKKKWTDFGGSSPPADVLNLVESTNNYVSMIYPLVN